MRRKKKPSSLRDSAILGTLRVPGNELPGYFDVVPPGRYGFENCARILSQLPCCGGKEGTYGSSLEPLLQDSGAVPGWGGSVRQSVQQGTAEYLRTFVHVGE